MDWVKVYVIVLAALSFGVLAALHDKPVPEPLLKYKLSRWFWRWAWELPIVGRIFGWW